MNESGQTSTVRLIIKADATEPTPETAGRWIERVYVAEDDGPMQLRGKSDSSSTVDMVLGALEGFRRQGWQVVALEYHPVDGQLHLAEDLRAVEYAALLHKPSA